MSDRIQTVLILGSSGTIGSLAGGLIAQKEFQVYFLSRTMEGAKRGLERAIAQARTEVIGENVICGDYDNNLQQAAYKADWILECVSENLEIKQQMYEKVEKHRRPECIVSSTTSSLPLELLVEGRSESFRNHFMSTHFYNPPGKMLACEISGVSDTKPETIEFMRDFLKRRLDRVVVPVINSVAFAGNRIAFILLNRITCLAQEYGTEMMDYLIGPYTGRLMPPLETIDLVGLDIHRSIIRNLNDYAPEKVQYLSEMPDYINVMIEKGCLGDKTPTYGGFYKKLEKRFLYIDPEICEYIPAINPHFVFVEKAKGLIRVARYQEAFEVLKKAQGTEPRIVRDVLCIYIACSYSLVGQVTDAVYGIDGIDLVMSFGFNWASPSLMVRMLGGRESTMDLLDKAGFAIPDYLKNGPEPTNYIFNSGKYFIAR